MLDIERNVFILLLLIYYSDKVNMKCLTSTTHCTTCSVEFRLQQVRT